MKNNMMDINALPALLYKLFAAEKVLVSEIDGTVHVTPVKETEDCTIGLRGILADYDNMSVEKFLERSRADKELDL